MEYVENGGVAYTPDNINQQLLSGASREQLAKLFGHKSWKTVDMFMRRKGYSWNGDKQVYEIKAKRPKNEDFDEEQTGSKRVRQILKSFKEGKDAKKIASELGFKNHLALAEYMKDKEYLWNHQEKCYQFKGSGIGEQEASTVSSGNTDKELEELFHQFLSNREEFDGTKNLPRYSLAGLRVAKTIQFSNRLNQLLLNFTADKNINQRECFEIAAIEMMKKYGYEAEIKGLLG
jgi:hypothetical protein